MFSKSLTKAIGSARFGTLSPSTLTQIHSHSARFITAQAKQAIDDAVKADPIVVFMKGNIAQPQCGFSKAVCQILEVQGVPSEKIKTYNVLDDPELRDAIKEYSEWPTIPQVYLNGEFVGGCDIFLGMHQSGELEDLLVKEKIISLEQPPAEGASSTEKKD